MSRFVLCPRLRSPVGLLTILACLAGAGFFRAVAAPQQQKSSQSKSSQKEQSAKPANDDVARGKAVFQDNCAECHDANSKDETVGPGLQGIKDGKLPDGREATADRLLDIINTGPAEMPSFKDRLSDDEKRQVVAYVLSL
jgi:mono/diheme cytochrome c family protein